MTNAAGHTIRGYEIRQQIGAGGFGAVYRAYQPVIEREVAIKVILPEHANQPDFIRRFETEAQLVARLEHPHIVPLYDYWRDPEGAYLVMRYLRGGSLQGVLQQNGALDLETTTRIMEQLTAALAVAHRNGIVHRDIKPANILLDEDGNAYLTDFGIATTAGSDTDVDMITGTVGYMAPELLMGMPPSTLSDVYSLGFVLFETLTGKHPYGELPPTQYITRHIHDALPSIISFRDDMPEAINAILMRATDKSPDHRYADVRMIGSALRGIFNNANTDQKPDTRAGTLLFQPSDEILSAGEATMILTWETGAGAINNPYKGLRAFQEADAADFFGREMLLSQIIERLKKTHFLAVIGPSGSGKSSVVRAGLIPAIRRGELPGSDQWFVVDMIPGAEPLQKLEAALLSVASNVPANFGEQLRSDPQALAQTARQIANNDILLVIDQFEEVFTQVESEQERTHFLALIQNAVAATDSPINIIITLRADFYDRPLLYEGFGSLVQAQTQVVLPLTGEELEHAIVRPAERVGVQVESELIAALVADVREEPGVLPLLQYVLTEVFERRDSRKLTLQSYHASGGVLGALARRAQEVYEGLTADQQSVARQIFLRLVSLTEGAEDTRRRALRSELGALGADKATVEHVLNAFGQYRLLTFDREPLTREPTVEVAHEALIRMWDQLQDWLLNSRNDIRQQRLLSASAADWLKNGKKADYLLRGARLAQFEEWAGESSVALTHEERTYLDNSIAERERETAAEMARQARELEIERSRRRLLVALVAVFGVMAALGIALSAFAFQQSQTAQSERDRAEQNLGLAVENANAAATNEAQALENANIAATNAAEAVNAAATATAALGLSELRGTEVGEQASTSVANANIAATNAAEAQLNAEIALNNAATATAALGLSEQRGTQVGEQASTSVANANIAATNADIALNNAATATAALGLSELRGTEVAQQASTSVANANIAATNAAEAQQNAATATAALGLSELRGTEVAQQASTSVANANIAATNAAEAQQNAATATAALGLSEQRGTEVANQAATSVANADAAATAQAIAVREAEISSSFAIVAYAEQALETDAALALTMAMEAYNLTDTPSVKVQQVLADAAYQSPRRELLGHMGAINSVAISPDNEWMLSAASDGSVRLWNLTSGQSIYELRWHSAAVNGVAFSPDGSRALSVSDDATMLLWDVATGAFINRFRWLERPIMNVAFTADGIQAVTGIADGSLIVWDLAQTVDTQQVISRFDNADALNLSLSADGENLLTSGTRLVRWQTRFWQPIIITDQERISDPFIAGGDRAVIGRDFFGNAIAISPDSRLGLTGGRGDRRFGQTPVLWDLNRNRIITLFTGHTAPVASLAFSPDGRTALSGSDDFSMLLWEIPSGTILRRFTGHTSSVTAIAYSHDGAFAVSGAADGTLLLWEATPANIDYRYRWNAVRASTVSFSPDGNALLMGSSSDTTMQYAPALAGEPTEILGQVGGLEREASLVKYVAFRPDGTAFTVSGGLLRLWDVGQQIQIWQNPTAFTPLDAMMSADGEMVVLGGGNTSAWFVNPGDVRATTFTHSELAVWDVANNRLVWRETIPPLEREPETNTAPIVAVAISADHRWIVTADASVITLWDVETREVVRQFSGHGDVITDMAFSPDGSTFISGSADNNVIQWDVASGRILRQLAGHVNDVTAVTFSPDGMTIASGAADGTLLLWDVASGQILRRFTGHTDQINQIVFDPSGHRLASAAEDGQVLVWRVELGQDLLDWITANRTLHSMSAFECEQYPVSALCADYSAIDLTPTPTPSPALQTGIVLEYETPDSFLLINRTGQEIDASGLVFVLPDGTERRFEASNWFENSAYARGAVGSINRLPDGGCYQIVSREILATAEPGNCTRHGWQVQEQIETLFWTFALPEASFRVLQGESEIATCEIAAGECVIQLP